MNDREKSILGPLIDDHKSLGIPERDISKIVYRFVFKNFNPAIKSFIDEYLREKQLPVIADNDPDLPQRK